MKAIAYRSRQPATNPKTPGINQPGRASEDVQKYFREYDSLNKRVFR